MSQPEFRELADGIATAINGAALGFTAVAGYVPNWSAATNTALECTVVPGNPSFAGEDRAYSGETFPIDLGFFKRLGDSDTKAAVDDIAATVHGVFKRFNPRKGVWSLFTLNSGARCRAMGVEYKAVYDPQQMTAKADGTPKGNYLSVFTVTFRVLA